MTTTPSTGPVVVGYDPSAEGEAAFAWAHAEATDRGVPLQVCVATGVTMASVPGLGVPTSWPYDLAERLAAQAQDYVRERAPEAQVIVDNSIGSPAGLLVRASQDAGVVVVSRGHHTILGEAVIGSTSAQVVAHASCPVVVVDRPGGQNRSAPIVVAVDGSEAGEAAIAFAFERAERLGAPVVAVHAWWVTIPTTARVPGFTPEQIEEMGRTEQRLLDVAIAPWESRYPDVEVRRALVHGLPVQALLGEAQDAQLIVVGSRGHGGFVGLLIGSVSQGLLHGRDRPCPLAVVHTRD